MRPTRPRAPRASAYNLPPAIDLLESRVLLSAQLVQDLRPGPTGSGAVPGVAVGDTVFFRANDGTHNGLWTTQGTPDTTRFVAPLPVAPSLDVLDWAAANGHAFWVAPRPATGSGPPYNLWTSDGTAEGTRIVHEIYAPVPRLTSPPGDPDNIAVSGRYVYFRYRPSNDTIQLWKTDGTEAGTQLVKSFHNTGINVPFTGVDVQGTLYFVMQDDATGNEIWKTDGTEAGTQVIDLSPGGRDSFIHSLIDVNGTLYFAGTIFEDGSAPRGGVFRSEGTVDGTELLAPVYLNLSTFEMEPVGDRLYFTGSVGEVQNYELWRTDGTPETTVRVKDIFSGPTGSNPVRLTRVADDLFFFANGGTNSSGLWKTDGTDAGTVLLSSVQPFRDAQAANLYPPGYTADAHGAFLFVGSDENLWRSDGTPAGTVLSASSAGSTPPTT